MHITDIQTNVKEFICEQNKKMIQTSQKINVVLPEKRNVCSLDDLYEFSFLGTCSYVRPCEAIGAFDSSC
jgi:hypothetical protein